MIHVTFYDNQSRPVTRAAFEERAYENFKAVINTAHEGLRGKLLTTFVRKHKMSDVSIVFTSQQQVSVSELPKKFRYSDHAECAFFKNPADAILTDTNYEGFML
jgi:hypothetical protein